MLFFSQVLRGRNASALGAFASQEASRTDKAMKGGHVSEECRPGFDSEGYPWGKTSFLTAQCIVSVSFFEVFTEGGVRHQKCKD